MLKLLMNNHVKLDDWYILLRSNLTSDDQPLSEGMMTSMINRFHRGEEGSLLAHDWFKERGRSRNEGVILSLADALVAG